MTRQPREGKTRRSVATWAKPGERPQERIGARLRAISNDIEVTNR